MSGNVRHIRVIPSLRRKLTAFLGMKVILGIWIALGLGALAAIAGDALIVLPESFRAHAVWILVVLALLVIAWGVIACRGLTEEAVARRLEHTSPPLGTALTNAVQLARVTLPTDTGEILRRQAVEYGRRKAVGAPVWPAVRRGFLIVFSISFVTAILWVGGVVLLPGVFNAVIPRYLDPHGDHPPYSRVHIEVESLDADVLYGGQCEIRARATGVPVEKLYLVAVNSRGEASTVMFRRPDQSHSQTLTNLREDTRFWVTDGRARSTRQTIHIRYTPTITFTEVKTTYPEYTGLREQTRRLKDTAMEVPKGSVIRFRVGSNRPLSAGVLELTPILGGDKQTVPMQPDPNDEQVVAGEFHVEQPVVFSLSLVDTAQLVSQDRCNGRVTILPDMRPRISVLEPNKHAVATPTVSIPVRIRAEDDYGVNAVMWFRGLNRSIARSVRMNQVNPTGPAAVEVRSEFPLESLGVRPGDRIEYFFEAVDNFPDGPNVATSRIYTVEIISVEQYKEILARMAAQRALFEQYMSLDNHLRRTLERAETLRDKLKEMQAKDNPTPEELAEQRRMAEELAKALADYRKGIDEAIATSPLFDIEQSFKEHLARQREAVDRMRDHLDRTMKDAAPGSALSLPRMEDLVKQLKDLAGDMNRTVGEPVRLITAVVHVLAMQDEFTRLALTQQELAQFAERFKEQKGELSRLQQMELQEISATQRRVKEGLESFVEKLPELLAQIPDEEAYDKLKKTAEEFLQKISRARIADDLAAATEKLGALDGPGGYPPAQSAALKMMALLKELGDSGMQGIGENCLCFQPGFGQNLGNTLSQILSALQGGGMGGSGSGYYGMIGEGVGLYGPDIQLAGTQTGRLGASQGGTAAPEREEARSTVPERELPKSKPTPVGLERNVKFPLRYRNLVGDYFRAVADSLGD